MVDVGDVVGRRLGNTDELVSKNGINEAKILVMGDAASLRPSVRQGTQTRPLARQM